MSGFADSVLLRHLGNADSVRPRIRSRFEPVTGMAGNQQETLFSGADLSARQEDVSSNRVEEPSVINLSPNAPPSPITTSETHDKNNQSPVTPSFLHPGKPEADKTGDVFQEINKDVPGGPVALSSEHFTDRSQQSTAGNKKDEKVEWQTEILNENIFAEGKVESDGMTDVSKGRLNASAVSSKKLPDALSGDSTGDEMDFFTERSGLLTAPAFPQGLQSIHPSFQQSPTESSRPVIKVTIGRVDVRATIQPEPAPSRSKPAAKPQLSLDDYLKQRNNPAR